MAYCSKFLVNRQKLINVVAITEALGKYFEYLPENKRKFIYRIEWYHIGISIPAVVYSEMQPLMQVFKECQLYELNQIEELPKNGSKVSFSIFAVPSKSNKEFNDEELHKWLIKKLADSAEIIDDEFGPHNCLYYPNSGGEQNCLQTYSIKGHIKIVDRVKLDAIRRKCVGFGSEFGCGLLEIKGS